MQFSVTQLQRHETGRQRCLSLALIGLLCVATLGVVWTTQSFSRSQSERPAALVR